VVSLAVSGLSEGADLQDTTRVFGCYCFHTSLTVSAEGITVRCVGAGEQNTDATGHPTRGTSHHKTVLHVLSFGWDAACVLVWVRYCMCSRLGVRTRVRFDSTRWVSSPVLIFGGTPSRRPQNRKFSFRRAIMFVHLPSCDHARPSFHW